MGQIKKQVPKNFILSIVGFSINFAVGIWLVPYLVSHLGTAAYGFIPLTAAFTQYVSFFTNSIVVSVSRFLTIEIQQGKFADAIKIYSTALMMLGGIIVILIPAFLFVAFNINTLLDVPSEIVIDCIWLFGLSFIAFFINLFSSIFKVPLYANNRLDIIKLIDILRIIVRLIFIVGLFVVREPSLKYVGWASFIASIFVFVASYFLGKRVYDGLILKFKAFSKSHAKELVSFGGWTFVHQGGDLLLFNVDILLINLLLGSDLAGEYGTILTWGNLIKAVSVTFSGLFGPVVLIYFAHNQKDKLLRVCKLGIKVLNFTLGTLIGILTGLSVPIINIWLGADFVHLANILTVKMMPLAFTFAVGSLFAVFRAYNKVKIPALVTLLLGVSDIILVFIFLKWLNWGMMGVALANAIVVLIQGGIFAPYYAAKILKIKQWIFYKEFVSGGIYLTIIFIVNRVIGSYIPEMSFIVLIMYIGSIALGTSIIYWAFFFSKVEKNELVSLLPKKFQKLIPFQDMEFKRSLK